MDQKMRPFCMNFLSSGTFCGKSFLVCIFCSVLMFSPNSLDSTFGSYVFLKLKKNVHWRFFFLKIKAQMKFVKCNVTLVVSAELFSSPLGVLPKCLKFAHTIQIDRLSFEVSFDSHDEKNKAE